MEMISVAVFGASYFRSPSIKQVLWEDQDVTVTLGARPDAVQALFPAMLRSAYWQGVMSKKIETDRPLATKYLQDEVEGRIKKVLGNSDCVIIIRRVLIVSDDPPSGTREIRREPMRVWMLSDPPTWVRDPHDVWSRTLVSLRLATTRDCEFRLLAVRRMGVLNTGEPVGFFYSWGYPAHTHTVRDWCSDESERARETWHLLKQPRLADLVSILSRSLRSDLSSRERFISAWVARRLIRESRPLDPVLSDRIDRWNQEGLLSRLEQSSGDDESRTFLSHLARSLMVGVSVASLRAGLQELQVLLEVDSTEAKYQTWCQENPWIFGHAYVLPDQVRQVSISDEVDFLLKEVASGFRDIVELKRPDKRVILYDSSRKSYHFSADVSRGLGQCFRYLDVLREAAKGGLLDRPEVEAYSPRATLVVGRSKGWGKEERTGLHILNRGLVGVTVITYDQLYLQGERLIQMLETPLEAESITRG